MLRFLPLSAVLSLSAVLPLPSAAPAAGPAPRAVTTLRDAAARSDLSAAESGLSVAESGLSAATTLRGGVVGAGSRAVMVVREGPDRDRLSDALLGGRELPAGFTPQPDAIDDLFARIAGEITACGKAGGLPETTVYREFVRGAADEELLVQTVSAPGAKQARAAVTTLGGVLPGCTSFIRAPGELPMELRFALSPYAQAPKIGDASAAIAFVMTVPTLNLTVNGRLLAVAAGSAHTTVLLMTESTPKTADLETATRTATTKLATLK